MKQLKKTILTLVALFAMTAGAWADAVPVTELKASDINAWIGDDTALTAADLPGFTAVSDEEVVNIPAPLTNGAIFMIYAFNGTNIKFVNYYNGAQVYKGEDYYNRDNIAYNAFDAGYIIYYTGTAPSGPKVTWDKDKKTGSFTMPGGNVTLEPEYYPQATVADGGVTAADADARATTDDPLVKVDATKLTGAKKLMYFVSNSGTTAPAYDADGWTDQLPNAEGFTQQGIVYVWYYPVGTDEGVDGATATYSDGDICLQSITARIAAAPTYAVTFAEGTDPNEWTASPATDVTKGQTVTVTYTGSKKVIGVKAEKKAAGVKVTAITLNKTATTITAGQTETLSVSSVTPDDATDQTVTWSSDNEAVATVDADGKVTAVALGTANITATANDGSGVTATCVVTVNKVVTINQSDWGNGYSRSFTKDGVTVSAEIIDSQYGNLMDGGTFSTTLGNFTKIVVTTLICYASGTGWSGSGSSMTWAGTPASTVSFSGDFMGRGSTQTTIVCTIEPAN